MNLVEPDGVACVAVPRWVRRGGFPVPVRRTSLLIVIDMSTSPGGPRTAIADHVEAI